ncbi:unnamed protein product [Owenia fusiformis]|uniref:Sterol regulatory element-binding protein cleavage-activating protein n=1 Tax=Owenia fusiformis TaxID=6347 RepID=A0A8J1UGZ2_OWEFU|nr:unnamed protein product [Owenia fusiformis]
MHRFLMALVICVFQEFCLFAVVGLCSDFFLQMVFFATVLSIDIRRMELSDLQHNQSMASLHDVPSGFAIPVNPVRCPVMALSPSMGPKKKSKASLKVQPIEINMDMTAGGAPPSPTLTPEDGNDPTVKKPKRLRLIFFWARTRMVQRAIMVCTVIWITLIVYKSGLVEHIIQISYSSAADNTSILHSTILKFIQQPTLDGLKGEVDAAETVAKFTHKDTLLVKHEDYETWKKLSYMHWPTLFGYYNISLAGRYISILPSIHLSDLINPNDAISLRHPEESKLATLKRELEESDPNSTQGWPTHLNHLNPKRLYPQSQTEAGVTFVLVFTTVVVVTYFMSWLYRCMCSRNYAKWRTSWTRLKRSKRKSSQYVKQIIDTLPLVLEGHKQEVECLVTDGPLIVSACLGGQIRVWDSTSGECLTAIPRKCITPPLRRKPCVGRNINDSDADLYAEYHGSPPTSDITQPQLSTASSMEEIDPFETFNQQSPSIHNDIFEHLPDLSDTIDTDFMSISKNSNSSNRSAHSVDSWTTSAPYQHDSRTKPQQRAGFQKHARNVSWDSGFNKYMAADSSSMDTPSQVKFNIGSAPDYTPHPWDNSQNLRRFSQDSRSGFDFSHFDKYYEDHKELMREKQAYEAHKVALRQRNVGPHGDGKSPQLTSNRKSWHGGEQESLEDYYEESLSDGKSCAAIWCVACTDNLIIAGCGNGRIEFWDGLTGTLKCLYQHNKVGATSICFIANRVIVARLNGGIDFLELETFQKSPVVTMAASASQPPKLHNRGHQRHHSLHLSGAELKCWDDVIHCNLITATRAHQRPINILQSEGGRVVTASEDHTLKVFRLEDSQCLYTLHGHGSSVTALYLDKGAPLAAASGSNDGCVRLWDLLTGACVHKLNAHSTTVNSISCTPVYVISSGQDDRLCIWERCKGLLMYCLQLDAGCCNAVAMMTSNLLVTGGQGCILLWDVSKGEVLRTVNLNSEDSSVFVRWIEVIGNAVVVCGYSHQVQVVHFPSVLEKVD